MSFTNVPHAGYISIVLGLGPGVMIPGGRAARANGTTWWPTARGFLPTRSSSRDWLAPVSVTIGGRDLGPRAGIAEAQTYVRELGYVHTSGGDGFLGASGLAGLYR